MTTPAAFNLRPLVIDDYQSVFALWQGIEGIGLGSSDSREGIAAFLGRNPGLSLVAVDTSGLVVGTLLCGHDGRRGYLHHLAVAKSHRRLGIARALVGACLQKLAALGLEKCNLFLYSNNEDGRAFWQRAGWTARTDLVLVQKPLMPERKAEKLKD